ncbi:MAG: FHA domain-containing protein [Dehalococcoidia bacterium]|nr:FHA domain-containing protein [Dehalococcoidia bacterium]
MGTAWILEVRSADGVQVVPLDGPLTIGRADELVDIALSDPLVSRRHCVVTPEDAHCVVDASESKNGLLLRGRRVDKAILRPGDVVSLGSSRLRVRGPSADPLRTLTQDIGDGASFTLHCGTRELIDQGCNRVAVLGEEESRFLATLIHARPASATFSAIGTAVWEDPHREPYSAHQLAYKLRKQLRGLPIVLESNKGIGYHLDGNIELA